MEFTKSKKVHKTIKIKKQGKLADQIRPYELSFINMTPMTEKAYFMEREEDDATNSVVKTNSTPLQTNIDIKVISPDDTRYEAQFATRNSVKSNRIDELNEF